MAEKALIFIPDISGFTKFVTQTELSHSNHIIAELIEIILAANQLYFKVSEIEGDAVLFYKTEELPSINEVAEQSKKMFIEFHKHLKIIERDNVCQCGACQSASELTLKFVVHYGELQEVAVQNFKKIMGQDVILAHLLLKSKINNSEYLLLTNKYFETQKEELIVGEWFDLKPHAEAFENFGTVESKFTELSPLHKQIPEVPENKFQILNNYKPDASIEINAPILKVHEVLIDNELKLKWVPGIKSIDSDSPINKVNSSHTCVFDDLEIHFVTLFNKKENQQISYTEAGSLGADLSFVSDYKLTESNGVTTVTSKIIPGKINGAGMSFVKKYFLRLKQKFIIAFSRRSSQKNLELFKNFVEEYSKN